MLVIPETSETPLIRTDFSDEVAWNELLEAAAKPSPHGFRANLHVINLRIPMMSAGHSD